MNRETPVCGLASMLRLAIVVVVLTGIAAGATVRGQLIRRSPHAPAGAAGVKVTVYSRQFGRSAASYSDKDGMFYVQHVPAGAYRLEIWSPPGSQKPKAYAIQVREPITDIPAITIP